MTRKSVYSVISVILLTILLLFTPFTRMTVHAGTGLPPLIALTNYSRTMSVGDGFYLIAIASNGRQPSFRSSKSSIASVNTYGYVTARKAGTCTITAKVKGAEASCIITVKPTVITMQPAALTLYRLDTRQLKADVSTGHTPVWRSGRSSVVTVDDTGRITAVKHGTAKITATADGVSQSCTVTVKQPEIRLSTNSLSLTTGAKYTISAVVTSKNTPEWSSSNTDIVSVDSYGRIQARKKGRAYVYAREDGVKARCTVIVRDPQPADESSGSQR